MLILNAGGLQIRPSGCFVIVNFKKTTNMNMDLVALQMLILNAGYILSHCKC